MQQEEKIKYIMEESKPTRKPFSGSDYMEIVYNGAPEYLSVDNDMPRLIMTLNEHDKAQVLRALESHPELIGKAYVEGNGLYCNGRIDLSALYHTWHNLPKK